MLDHAHLGDSIGQIDDFLGTPPAGQTHMYVARALGQRIEHVLQGNPAIDQRVGDLIQYDKEMPPVKNRLPGPVPAIARELRRMLQVFAFPAEAIAQAFYRNADLLEHAVLAEPG